MNDESLRGDPALSNRIKAKTKYDGNNFSEYEYYNIMIGEESGALAVALNELAAHYKTRLKQKRQLVSALSYPILVLVVAFAAVTFMLNVIVPMFAGVFQRFGGELPAITQTILNISNFLSAHILAILIILGLIVAVMSGIKR
jgi:type IV pilus assembly protein PilC